MQLQGLTRIIGCFKPAESDFIREYYLRKNNGSATKRLQLFDLLNNRFAKSNDQLSKLLYNRKPDSGFSQLKKRLKEDLLDFLVFFSSNKGDKPDNNDAELECRRLFVQAKTLVSKGIPDEAINVLKRVQRISRENDLPSVKGMALDLLQEISDQSFSDFKANADKVEQDFELHLLKIRARNLYTCISKDTVAVSISEKELEILRQLKALQANTASPGLAYWHHLLQMIHAKQQGNFARAYRHGLKLTNDIASNVGQFNKGQQLDFYLEMAQLMYEVQRPVKAELFARKAEMLCINDCPDLLRVLQVRFVLHFSAQDYAICDQILSQALLHPGLREDEAASQIWLFFEACTRFVEEDFRMTGVLLQRSAGLAREKNGFFLEHRILELLNLIELEDHDLLEYKVESFRKLIDYHQDLCPDHVPQVLKVLRAFVRTSYDLEAAIDKEVLINVDRYQGLIDVKGWLSKRLQVEGMRMVG